MGNSQSEATTDSKNQANVDELRKEKLSNTTSDVTKEAAPPPSDVTEPTSATAAQARKGLFASFRSKPAKVVDRNDAASLESLSTLTTYMSQPPSQNMSREGSKRASTCSQSSTPATLRRASFEGVVTRNEQVLTSHSEALMTSLSSVDTSAVDDAFNEFVTQVRAGASQRRHTVTSPMLLRHSAFRKLMDDVKTVIAHEHRKRVIADDWTNLMTRELEAHICARIAAEDELRRAQDILEHLQQQPLQQEASRSSGAKDEKLQTNTDHESIARSANDVMKTIEAELGTKQEREGDVDRIVEALVHDVAVAVSCVASPAKASHIEKASLEREQLATVSRKNGEKQTNAELCDREPLLARSTAPSNNAASRAATSAERSHTNTKTSDVTKQNDPPTETEGARSKTDDDVIDKNSNRLKSKTANAPAVSAAYADIPYMDDTASVLSVPMTSEQEVAASVARLDSGKLSDSHALSTSSVESPVVAPVQGFSFDDILKANLDILSSDDDLDVDLSSSRDTDSVFTLASLATAQPEAEVCVTSSAKFWNEKLTRVERDKTSETPDLGASMLENIQKTKLRWEELACHNGSSPASGSESRDESETETLTSSPLKMTSSASPAMLRKMSVEGDALQPDIRRATESWEKRVEGKAQTRASPRTVRLVSKTFEELECDVMSLDVNSDSIANVSSTKSKWEHLLRDDDAATGARVQRKESGRLKRGTLSKATDFDSLRGKFELKQTFNGEDSSEC